jgi:hypothetical protein
MGCCNDEEDAPLAWRAPAKFTSKLKSSQPLSAVKDLVAIANDMPLETPRDPSLRSEVVNVLIEWAGQAFRRERGSHRRNITLSVGAHSIHDQSSIIPTGA